MCKYGNVMFEINDFSRIALTKIYLKAPLAQTVKFNLFDYTDEYWRLQECIDDVISFVNGHGGFTIFGWYKRGETNDVPNEDSDIVVESETNWYHVVSVYPTNRDIFKHTELKKCQFSMS